MYYRNSSQTYLSDGVPVSVTMEDDKTSKSASSSSELGDDTGNQQQQQQPIHRNSIPGSDISEESSGRTTSSGGGPRLLQVTMPGAVDDGKEALDASSSSSHHEPTTTATLPQSAAAETAATDTAVTDTAAPSNTTTTSRGRKDSVGTFSGISNSSNNNDSDSFLLQGPSALVGDDQGLEAQIKRDVESLTDSQRQQVYADMRGEIFKAVAAPAGSSARSASSSSTNATHEALALRPVSDSDLSSLHATVLRLLNDPDEQSRHPTYSKIAKSLESSTEGQPPTGFQKGLLTKLLRAEHSDIPKASQRTVEYLSLLWESFGEELLTRPIKLSDLTTTERQLQRKGYQQLFRFRDQSEQKPKPQSSSSSSGGPSQPSSSEEGPPRESPELQRLRELDTGAGRRIAGSFDLCRCVNTSDPTVDDETSKTRILLYMMQVASEDEETQKQGIVFIFMLALRAVFGSNPVGPNPFGLLPVLPTSEKPAVGATVAVPSTTAPSSVLGAPPAAASGATTTIENENIFAGIDSNSDSDKSSTEARLDQLQFSPNPSNNNKPSNNHTLSRVRVLSKVFRCGLVRVAAIHLCSPSRPELQPVKMDFLRALGKLERVRTRFHNGTSMECSLSLSKVGIPTDRLPLKYDGTIKTEDHLQWIAIQEAKEQAAKQNRAFDIVECPMNMDILSGRGQLVRSHPGNVSFRKDFIWARSARYDMAANREEKNTIADEILDDICTLKRKFLKQHQGAGYWTELDRKTAKEKVMMAFREFRKSQRNQQQQQARKTKRQQPEAQRQQPPPHPVRPSLPMSQAVQHSPVNLPPGSQRQGLRHEPQEQPDFHHPDDHPYQSYNPSSSIGAPAPDAANSGMTVPGESFHHPQQPQHMVGMPQIPPPPLSYYQMHPPPMPPGYPYPYGYGHPLPPHLLPPPIPQQQQQQQHPFSPHNLADNPSNPGIAGAAGGPPQHMGRSASSPAAATLPDASAIAGNIPMGYGHNASFHGEEQQHLSQQQQLSQRRSHNNNHDEHHDERSYKRYRTI